MPIVEQNVCVNKLFRWIFSEPTMEVVDYLKLRAVEFDLSPNSHVADLKGDQFGDYDAFVNYKAMMLVAS